jgi:ABC-2 type transport system permease protein
MIRSRRTIRLVAARELTERTQSRAFAISTLVLIAVVLAGVIVPGLKDDPVRLKVGLAGATPAALTGELRAAATAQHARLQLLRFPNVAAGQTAVRHGRAGVLIVAGRRLVWDSEPDARLANLVAAAVQRLRYQERSQALGLSPAQATALLAPAPLPERRLEPVPSDQDARETIAMVAYLVLLMMVLWYGSAVADGVAQEKGGRVMELLVSRVRPRELLAGKILGIGAVGLGQMLLALAAAAAAIIALDTIEVPDAVPATLAATALWFLLGYAFWSVAYGAAAALVSRVEDLQAAAAPVGWALVLSALTAPIAGQYPDAWYVQVASLCPPTAPFVMPVRIAVAQVAAWQLVLAAAVMLAATYGLVRVAGAVYSGALLRTAGRPRVRDLWDAARAR